MTKLEYYPSFTSYSDNHGNTADGLLKDVNGRDVRFDAPTLRPGDVVEMRVAATDPRNRRMELVLYRGPVGKGSLLPAQVISSGDEAVFTWTIENADVGQGIRFTIELAALDTDYHRMRGADQRLSIQYQIDPPADY